MQVRIFTLRFNPVTERFDDTAVVGFLADTEQKRDESWRELLTEADWPLFNTLRAWRMERSRQEGISPYVVCNNRQLAEVAKNRP